MATGGDSCARCVVLIHRPVSEAPGGGKVRERGREGEREGGRREGGREEGRAEVILCKSEGVLYWLGM